MSGLIFNGNGDVIKAVDGSLTIEGLDLGGGTNVNAGIGTFSDLNVTGTLTYEDVKNVDSVGIISARQSIHVGYGVSAAGIITATSYRGDGSQLTGITQVGGATTVGFDDNKPIYFGSQDDYKMYWNGTRMYLEPTSSSTTQILEIVSNNQMYINSKASGLFLMSGDQNVIDIYGGGGGGIYFKHNGTQKLKLEGGNWTYLNGATVTHAGDVSIPDSIIHVGDTNTKIRFPANDTITAETGGTERLRIDSSGRLLKGLTSARGNYANNTSGVEYAFQVEGLNALNSTLSLIRDSNDANDGGIVLGKTRATSVGGNTVVQASDDLGSITWAGSDGTTLQFGAEITAQVESGVGNDDMPAALIFKTNGGTTSTTERLRISSGGQVNIGSNFANPGELLTVPGNIVLGHRGDNVSRYIGKGTDTTNFGTIGNASSNANSSWIGFVSGTGSGYEDEILFGTHKSGVGGGERMRITGLGRIGIGVASPDGMLHVFSASAGSVNTDADADELTLENSGNVGLSLLTAATGESSIYFGNPGTNGQKDGWIKYYHESHSTTANRRALTFKSGGGSEKMRLTSGGQVLINTTTSAAFASRLLTISDVTSGGTTAMEIRSATNGTGRVYFTDSTNSSDAGSYAGKVLYDHNTDHMAFWTNGNAERLRIGPAGQIGIAGANYGSSGQVLTSQGSSATVQWASPGGVTHISQWEHGGFTANNTNGDLTASWSECNQANYGNTLYSLLGSSLTQSSGIFSFPSGSEGHWLISHALAGYCQNTNNRILGNRIYISTNSGASWSQKAHSQWNNWDGSGVDNGVVYGSCFCQVALDITSVSSFRIKFWYQTENNAQLSGGTGNHATFIRLADT